MLRAGDKLDATIECPACGGNACMSVTKNMTIFAYCKTVVDKATNEKCGYRGFLGRTKSKEIIAEYNENMKGIENVQTQHEEETGNIEHNPSSRKGDAECGARGFEEGGCVGEANDPAKSNERGIAGAIKHFLTASE